jgi:hypothetical protein
MIYRKMDATSKQYLSNYAYVVRYEWVDKETGEIMTDFITVASAKKLSPSKVSEEFYNWFDEEGMFGDRYDIKNLEGNPMIVEAWER